jgi:hypothetical protein
MNQLEKTKKLFENVRSSIVQAMQALHKVKESEQWKEVAPTFGEYVEQELGISQGFASKLLGNNQTYLLEGQVSPEKLAGIDYEKLYMARNLPGSLEERIEKARLLSRRELREEKNDEVEHAHEAISICKTCHIRL